MSARTYQRHPDAVWREETAAKERVDADLEAGEDVADVGTSLILFRGKMISLNILGTEIWQLCDGHTFDEIVDGIAEIFDVEREILREDVGAFLTDLEQHGVIT